jgi:glycosyltransferase involved in cell wall biosynthesis
MNISMFTTTYPNKVFDYMAAARPTILAIDGVIRQVIEDADGGLVVPPGDAKALAEAVRELSCRPERGVAMGHSARKYVVKHFNRRVHACRLEQLLLAVSSNGRSMLVTRSGEPRA